MVQCTRSKTRQSLALLRIPKTLKRHPPMTKRPGRPPQVSSNGENSKLCPLPMCPCCTLPMCLSDCQADLRELHAHAGCACIISVPLTSVLKLDDKHKICCARQEPRRGRASCASMAMEAAPWPWPPPASGIGMASGTLSCSTPINLGPHQVLPCGAVDGRAGHRAAHAEPWHTA